MNDKGDNFTLDDITSKDELARLMTVSAGRVQIVDVRGDLYKIKIVNYKLDGDGKRIRSDQPAMKRIKNPDWDDYDRFKEDGKKTIEIPTEEYERPFLIESLEGWVSL